MVALMQLHSENPRHGSLQQPLAGLDDAGALSARAVALMELLLRHLFRQWSG
ncbi:MAG: hypothetical protein AVDCRST_MAG73-290 [uncultured Thermomicrobiales bacterium]|uniref:Uncharacterized protein n=1 Tax=uncultured Thermomicrobiales bacterium TaxID=1645740 RepID=A0A6J4TGB5_9BACT|nr:MAG: hypothetical protein AVDCRST_MAG73-290 [uncultured Thermomicrobiales bacterium]